MEINKIAFNFHPKSEFYVFRKRSCRNCTRRTECRAVVGRDWSARWLDCGLCGCEAYAGPYIGERKKQGKKVGRPHK